MKGFYASVHIVISDIILLKETVAVKYWSDFREIIFLLMFA